MQKRIPSSKRRALIAMPPDRKVRIWTLQAAAAWEAAKVRGFWTGSAEHVDAGIDLGRRNSLRPQYEWMRRRMAERLAGFSGDFPIWAHLARPNLRQCPHFDSPTVLLVAEVPRGRMLVSDLRLWDSAPMTRSYCAWTKAEDDAFEGEGGLAPAVVASWDRVFDIADRSDPEVIAWCGQADSLQACVDRIHPHEVILVRPVAGRVGRNARTE